MSGPQHSSLNLRTAWIVFWRVRSTVYRGQERAPWWAGWRTTFRAWWMVGHGTRYHG